MPRRSRKVPTEKRIVAIQCLCITLFGIYMFKLFSIQVLSNEQYQKQAHNITRRITNIPAQRGEIFDRQRLAPLVMNADAFAVSVVPGEVPPGELSPLIDRLAVLINIPRDRIDQKIPPEYFHLFQPIEIAMNVPFETIARIAEVVDILPGVSWQSKPMRNYIDMRSLSHVVGYVGDITQGELTMLYNRGYQRGDVIGKSGIEKQYDEILRGLSGQEIRTVDVKGRRVGQVERESPVTGKNLVLTIDREIQNLVEKALGERIGAAVVLKPSTGEILALVSYPWYDPNIFNQVLDTEYQNLIKDPNKPFLNRVIQSSYPPASTFKIVMTTGVLAEHAFPTDQTVNCLGELSYGDRLWHCHIRKPGHGYLNLQQAMAQSCDIYYWIVGRDHLGIENIVTYALEYGYGEVTNVDLPGEIAGFIPDPQWKERRFHESWVAGDTMNMSIGQGYTLVTPLQMANMVAMVVNDGVIYQPHLLKEIRDPLTDTVEESIEPQVLHKTNTISPDIFRQVRHDMRTVISEGTARFPLNIRSVQIAGKTGTGEIGIADRWHSWFAAFAPYQTSNPDDRIVLSIIVEAVNKWEWWAPYASAIIFQGIFANQSYEEAVTSLGLEYLMPVQGRRE
ncbi:MAG: penicillin-binding protein 2 [Spirochaetaceae bacterium]|jgi:penicillin-binding protein 2|nr:penicillin-binding protein 2 [Spirochaetaceae bacterium]